mmetsp:Transcript_1933/g.5117  ORF Transcript_1933/g.5117 Transcript_1933/m.5117 type:complete len:223 (-) Transcript_1933:11-679(-)
MHGGEGTCNRSLPMPTVDPTDLPPGAGQFRASLRPSARSFGGRAASPAPTPPRQRPLPPRPRGSAWRSRSPHCRWLGRLAPPRRHHRASQWHGQPRASRATSPSPASCAPCLWLPCHLSQRPWAVSAQLPSVPTRPRPPGTRPTSPRPERRPSWRPARAPARLISARPTRRASAAHPPPPSPCCRPLGRAAAKSAWSPPSRATASARALVLQRPRRGCRPGP